MKIKLSNIFLLKTLYLIAAGIVITQVLNLELITSVLFMLTFPMTILLWMSVVRKTVLWTDIVVLCTAALAIICVLMDASISIANVSFSYMRKVIMFVMSLLFFQTAHRLRVDQTFKSFIDKLVDILTIFFIVMYNLQNSQMYLMNGIVTGYLTFRFNNPNLTGLFLTCLYMLEVYRLFSAEKWIWKVVHIAMAVYLARFVLETQSRNCLLVFVMFTAACAWLVFRSNRKLRISKGLAVLISLLPALFVMAYTALVYNPWILNTFDFLVGEGKRLNSRMKIWRPALEAINNSPLIGAYCDISGGTGMSQMHNSHLDIASSYGIPVLILVCILLVEYLYQKGRYYDKKESYIYILAFVCAIMLGIGEAAIFSGGLGIYLFVGAFLLLANKTEIESRI